MYSSFTKRAKGAKFVNQTKRAKRAKNEQEKKQDYIVV